MKMPVKKMLSGSTLKWIAILTMLIDHIGACILEVFVLDYYGISPLGGYVSGERFSFWYEADMALRLTGRIAFPVFCFLLVEGALHTRNMGRYAGRLAVFALVSEIPFDLAFHDKIFYPGGQNVFLTLLLGLLAIWILKSSKGELWRTPAAVLAPALAAEYLHTDYGALGVLVILLMYILRNVPWLRFLACYGALVFLSPLEWPCILSFVLIALSSGERGRQPRYFFYVFYPAHLVLLWTIGRFVLPSLLH